MYMLKWYSNGYWHTITTNEAYTVHVLLNELEENGALRRFDLIDSQGHALLTEEDLKRVPRFTSMSYGYNHSYIFYAAPRRFYDDYGYHHFLNRKWEHGICVMDDFGDAVPVGGFHHGWEEEPTWAPGPGTDYVQHYPVCH